MIFISQSGITDRSQEPAWAEWYCEHLRIMRTVDGISSASRYTTDTPGWPPSLAMYSIRSPAVFEDARYQRVRGMGEWLSLIDRRYYQRNLFEGLELAPEVPPGQVLLVIDRDSPVDTLKTVSFSWLKSVGLDRSTPYRGIAVVPAEETARLRAMNDVAFYLPLTRG